MTLVCLLAVTVVLLPPSDARAQQGGLGVDGGVIHSEPPAGVDVPAATYGLLGLRTSYGTSGLGWISASLYGGLAAESEAGDWGSLDLAGEIWSSPRGAAVGVGAEATGFAVGAPSEYRAVAGRLYPQIRYVTADYEIGVRGIGGTARSVVESRESFGPFRVGQDVASDLELLGLEPRLDLSLGPAVLGLRAAYLDSYGGIYRRAGLRLSGSRGQWGWNGGLRVWDTPRGTELTGLLSLSVSFGGGWTVQVSGRRSDPDPLLQTTPAPGGGLTVSRRLVDFTPTPDAAVVEVTRSGERRFARFRIEASGADDVAVVGDFTNWEPVPMRRQDGQWSVRLPVEPGVYHFGFRVDGEWHVPEDAPGRVADDWGRTNATLVVSSS